MNDLKIYSTYLATGIADFAQSACLCARVCGTVPYPTHGHRQAIPNDGILWLNPSPHPLVSQSLFPCEKSVKNPVIRYGADLLPG